MYMYNVLCIMYMYMYVVVYNVCGCVEEANAVNSQAAWTRAKYCLS